MRTARRADGRTVGSWLHRFALSAVILTGLMPGAVLAQGTIAEIAAMYDKHPASRRALAQAGFTSREFVIFTFALMQAGMGAWLVDQHGWQQLPKEVARENVLFYQRHRAELDRLTAEMKERNQQDP